MTNIIRHISRLALLAVTSIIGVTTATAGTEVAQRLYDTTAISIGTVTGGDGNEYSTIEWPGMSQTAEVGAPTLPVEYIRFIVPVYTNNFRVSVNNITRTPTRKLPHDLYPAQEPVTTGSDAPIVFTSPAPEAYSMTHSIRAEVVDDGFIDGCNHLVTVAVYPMSYTPGTGGLSVANSFNVTLEYDECAATELKDTPIVPPTRSQYIELDSLVVNKARTASRQYVPNPPFIGTETKRESYYIITPSKLKDAFEDLARWKRQKGYTVHVKTIEDIYAQYKPGTNHSCSLNGNSHNVEMVDSAASLRTFLQDEYTKNGAFFCLLAGDWTTSMPIRYACKSTYSKADIHGESFIPTDNYFSDLTSGWELKECGTPKVYSADYDKLTYNPDIFVGRLLCRTKEDIQNYIKKLIIYEAHPGYGDDEYLSTAFFYEQNHVKKGSHIHYSLPVRHFCEVNKKFKVELFQDHSFTGEPGDFPTGTHVTEQMEISGYSSWNAHGSPYAIATCTSGSSAHQLIALHRYKALPTIAIYPQTDKNAIDDMTNYTKPGVVYTISCETAPFDSFLLNWVYKTDYTLGASYTNNKVGGVAFLANTRGSYGGIDPMIL